MSISESDIEQPRKLCPNVNTSCIIADPHSSLAKDAPAQRRNWCARAVLVRYARTAAAENNNVNSRQTRERELRKGSRL